MRALAVTTPETLAQHEVPAAVAPLVPEFLKRSAPRALYAFRSDERLVITKGDTSITLDPADLIALRGFVARFEGETE